jgi:glyoxylase-like metal-dependent hydrolase (beta-lactamase superfamily II)
MRLPSIKHRQRIFLAMALHIILSGLAVVACAAPGANRFVQAAPDSAPDLFVWTDTCNTYVLRDGDAALLIDLGDGSVLDHLADIGVKQVDWVLFTHHHREQSMGAPRLRGTSAKNGAPEAERAFFERPTDFRKMNVRLGDPFTVHGASYVRPPIQAIPLDRAFNDNDTLEWRGHRIECLSTPGNSPGAMTYRLRVDNRWLAFTGDVILDGARMHTWFDTEWDYGFAAGIQALRKTVARLQTMENSCLLPAQGPVIRNPAQQLRLFSEKLELLERLYVRGYGVEAASSAYQDKVSKPTAVTNVWQISPHLFKFKRPNFWGNFGLILADSGRALVVDCGLLSEAMLDQALEGMRQHFGLQAIDAVIVTHMHGDHFLEAPHLVTKWGAEIWALENMVDKMEHPERFDYPAMIQAYGKKNPDGSPMTSLRVDRAFNPGESFDWEGYTFTVDWMPGQTEFALCLHGEIDGRKVAFTGDNIFGDPSDPTQTGHEAVVARNSAILEEGYIYAGEYLAQLKPDILFGGHSFVMDRPAAFIERYRRWGYEMREAFQALSLHADYRYWFDPFWVRAEPYRVPLQQGKEATVTLHVRNFLEMPQQYRIHLRAPEGVRTHPEIIEQRIPASTTVQIPVRVETANSISAGVHMVALDVTIDGHRHGPLFDFIIGITAQSPGAAAGSHREQRAFGKSAPTDAKRQPTNPGALE